MPYGRSKTQMEADSGYGGSSAASYQTDPSRCDTPLDADATSTTSTVSCGHGPSLVAEKSQPRPALRPFTKPIDGQTQKRANDVMDQMSEFFKDFFQHSWKTKFQRSPSIPNMAIRCISLGTTMEKAEPCLVIFCDDKGEGATGYRYLDSRIMELYEELETPTPRGFLEKWLERKSGARYVMMATLGGVAIAVFLGALALAVSIFQAWVGWQQWQHPVGNS
ncbi:hypothetical protein FZEAL_9113 [Fusarium zealandicum]|uniref:Uncharacterized protein n=1 Tax=Fusarium zealandicum TaxID=1053134 RepID=A0A8H4UCI1_9HYPO|nr:hypothetical protein FZEAL_9113 [Fusarium zealandicum]